MIFFESCDSIITVTGAIGSSNSWIDLLGKYFTENYKFAGCN